MKKIALLVLLINCVNSIAQTKTYTTELGHEIEVYNDNPDSIKKCAYMAENLV